MEKDNRSHLDLYWYVVRTKPRGEEKMRNLLEQYKKTHKNILEIYAPTHTTVNVDCGNRKRLLPLFAGIVLVYATREALVLFAKEHSLGNILQYERKQNTDTIVHPMTIPEEQIRIFKDFNENYTDDMIVLERPYSDYIFNPKTNESNEIVRILDGPLAGREGYVIRYHRSKRIVFKVKSFDKGGDLAVSISNVGDFRAIRLHNAESNLYGAGTTKECAVDLLIGVLQGCGYGKEILPMLYAIVDILSIRPSLNNLCQDLLLKGHDILSHRLKEINIKEAELIINLARYEHDNPGYVRRNWSKFILRPFLTPVLYIEMFHGMSETKLYHKDFTEIIRKVEITENVYFPSREKEEQQTTTYLSHVGIINNKDNTYTIFTNWDNFLGEYFFTADMTNARLVMGKTQMNTDDKDNDNRQKKLMESFRNYAPTLYKVLTYNALPIMALSDFRVGNDTLNVMATITTDKEKGIEDLIRVCTDICQEINTTTHLATWRRYLRCVWLHS